MIYEKISFTIVQQLVERIFENENNSADLNLTPDSIHRFAEFSGVQLKWRPILNWTNCFVNNTYEYTDQDFLEIAFANSALLITEDKDFGELAFRFQLKHSGILLVRMIEAESKEKADEVIKSVKLYFEDMLNNFSVLDNRKLRIRK